MEFIGQIGGTIVNFVTGKVGEQIGYLIHYKHNVKNLKEQFEILGDRRDDVQRQVRQAENNLEEIEGKVKTWLRRVDDITSDANKFLEADQEKANHRCFNGWCINLWARYKFGKEAFEKASEITEHQDTKFESVSHRVPLPEIVLSSSSKMFEGSKSRKTMVNKIMKALEDENVNVIGVCGMGGVGKTTIVEEVCRKAQAEKKFDKIVMVVVSQPPNLAKIQEKVGSVLGLEALKNMEESKRASALWGRIKRERNILVVFDDVWSRLDLKEVGIPFGDDHKGCKIVLTSRSQDVCSEMDAQKTFRVEVLSDQEAWVLFREMVGEKDADSPNLNLMAREMARGCCGLPIAIVTVARALKNRSKDVWIDAARQSKKPVPNTIGGMAAFVYSRLKLSYNYLETKEAKSLFLLCSLFPEDAEIPVELLVRYGMGLRLFQEAETIEDARIRTFALVSTLQSSFLLLESASFGLVKMHDVVRDVAIEIATKEEENKYLVKAASGLEYWPDDGTTFQNYSGISLIQNHIHKLPDGLEFPNLQTLLLQKWYFPKSNLEIPPNFFEGMKGLKVLDMSGNKILKVLDMSGNKILSLPPSISLLTSLKTLFLDQCGPLGDISIIGMLKQLEILSLSRCTIVEVPRHFTQLTHLRSFDLRGCYGLERISPGVISSLCKLEELHLGMGFTSWAVEGGDENSRSNASLAELKFLSRLTCLTICVLNADMLPHDLEFRNLIRFDIGIGSYDFPCWPKLKNTLCLTYETRLSGPIEVLLKKTEVLVLERCKGLENILKDLDNDGFPELKVLSISGCDDAKHLLDTVYHRAPRVAFRNLEELQLLNCSNFSEICHGQLIPSESFGKVRTLSVEYCNSMRNIVPSSLLIRLQNLERVDACGCGSLLNVFVLEEGLATEGEDTALLSRLRELNLSDLPELMDIWKGCNHFVNLGSLRSVSFERCAKTRQVFPPPLVEGLVRLEDLFVDSCGGLEEIFGTYEEAEERTDGIVVLGKSRIPSTSLQNLTKVLVQGCDRLRSIFPPSVAKGLVHLRELHIESCAVMEAIAEYDKGEETVSSSSSIEKIVFPRLNKISLDRLDNLTCFCIGRCGVEYPSLEQVTITACPKMETFGHGVQMTPKLKKVDVHWRSEGIWMGDINSTVQHIFGKEHQQQEEKEEEQKEQPPPPL